MHKYVVVIEGDAGTGKYGKVVILGVAGTGKSESCVADEFFFPTVSWCENRLMLPMVVPWFDHVFMIDNTWSDIFSAVFCGTFDPLKFSRGSKAPQITSMISNFLGVKIRYFHDFPTFFSPVKSYIYMKFFFFRSLLWSF